jgi:mannosyltransferase OCH1-like enzyme
MYYYLIFFLLIIVYFEYFNKKNENFYIETVIPLNIYQTWHTKELPYHMQKNVDKIRETNPEFKYHLYNDEECRDFIDTYFNDDVLNAYDRLIPGAYKADLWRYCILYIHGGIYLDMKMRCVGDFKLIELVNQEHYVKDIQSYNFKPNSISIYNAVMIQKKHNPFLMECINQIVNNVNNNVYGFSSLYPTGPGMVGELYLKYKYDYRLVDIDMFHIEDETILYKERIILEHYPEYRQEQLHTQKDSHYSLLWNEQSIYKL